MIEKLTKQQEALIPIYRDEWIKHGLAYKNPNYQDIKEDIDWLYEFPKLEKPKYIICLESPLACLIGIAVMKNFNEQTLQHQVGAQVTNQVGAQVWAQVGAQVWEQVGAQVTNQVRDQVWEQVGAQVWAQVRDQVGAQVDDQVRDQVRAHKLENFSSLDIRNWSGWFGYLTFFKDIGLEIGEELASDFERTSNILKQCYWIYPFKGVCFISHSPKHTHMVDGQLHNEEGPSIEFSDGFSVYSINGVRVPEKVVMAPETITMDDIKNEGNAEVKRIVRERYGTGRYLNEIGAKPIDVGVGPSGHYRALMVDDDGNKYLCGTDGSTKRVYYMLTNKDVETCEQAHNAMAPWNETKDMVEA